MSYSQTWQNARIKRAERRANDPQVQARAAAHARREAAERQAATRRAERAAATVAALDAHLEAAS